MGLYENEYTQTYNYIYDSIK